MDGVLIDAREWHYTALNKALGLFGFEINRYEHLVTYDGLPTKDKLNMLSSERLFPKRLHNIVNELKQQYTMEIVHQLCKPTFHHEFALSTLKKQGYRLAVCSNSIRSTVETMMAKSNLIGYLDFFLSNQDVKKGKPDPEMYINAIAQLGFAPDECLIVEDNDHGIQAAKGSGAHILRVADPSQVNFQAIDSRIKELVIP